MALLQGLLYFSLLSLIEIVLPVGQLGPILRQKHGRLSSMLADILSFVEISDTLLRSEGLLGFALDVIDGVFGQFVLMLLLVEVELLLRLEVVVAQVALDESTYGDWFLDLELPDGFFGDHRSI